MSEYYGNEYDELDYGPGIHSLAADLEREYHRNRSAREVVMRNKLGDTERGALWWRGGPEDAVVTMRAGAKRFTYPVSWWTERGWTLESLAQPR
jgi:hypothetical protein